MALRLSEAASPALPFSPELHTAAAACQTVSSASPPQTTSADILMSAAWLVAREQPSAERPVAAETSFVRCTDERENSPVASPVDPPA